MLARVTTWEGGTPEGVRSAAEEMRGNIGKGPPEGMRSTGITMLVDPDGGRVLMVGLFEDEAALQDSEAILKQMNPPEGMGSMVKREVWEVAAEARL